MIDAKMLEILACPVCKGDVELAEDKQSLLCLHCGYRYPVIDGIPVMLKEKGTPPPEMPEEETAE